MLPFLSNDVIRPKAYLVFHHLISLFRPRSIHLPAHQAIPSLGIAPPSCIQYIHQYTGILASHFIQNTFMTFTCTLQDMGFQQVQVRVLG